MFKGRKKKKDITVDVREDGERDLFRCVKRYFNDVILTKDFIIAVDATGVYLFTNVTDEDFVLIRASTVMSDLDLRKGELVICQVSPEFQMKGYNSFSFSRKDTFTGAIICKINPSEFEDDVREILGGRGFAFSTKEIIEIVNCYQQSVLEGDGLAQRLGEFGLTDSEVEAIQSHVVQNPLDLINECGIDPEIAEDVFQEIQEFYRAVSSGNGSIRASLDVIDDRKAGNLIVLSLLMFVLASVFVLLKVWVLSIVLAIVGLVFSHDLAVTYKTFWSTLCRVLNWCVLIAAASYLAVQLAPIVMEKSSSLDFQFFR